MMCGDWKDPLADYYRTARIAEEIRMERQRQEAKFPNQDLPLGYDRERWLYDEEQAREDVAVGVACGTLTWADVLREEFFEALAAEDAARCRAELIQVAAVAARAVECFDRMVEKEGA